MKTFYDILKINQNATQEEIIEAYNKLEKKYKNDQKNLKNIQIALEILTNQEARKNYDEKLYEVKQNELISNITDNTLKYNIKKQEADKVKNEKRKEEILLKERINNKKIDEIRKNNLPEQTEKDNLQIEKKLRKEQKKQEKLKNKELRKEEKKKKELYEEAYAKYLESLGFKIKRRWTLKRIKRLIYSIICIIVFCIVLWNIPQVKKGLMQLYENNFIIKLFVDLIGSILEMIYNAIKRILESW